MGTYKGESIFAIKRGRVNEYNTSSPNCCSASSPYPSAANALMHVIKEMVSTNGGRELLLDEKSEKGETGDVTIYVYRERDIESH